MSYFNAILALIGATFVPGLELRFSIPLGFFKNDISQALGIPMVILVCLLANVVVGILVYELMYPIEKFLRKWSWFDHKIWPIFEKKREKLRPTIEKYGVWGVAVFIGVPLPGTGAYTGAVGAYLLNLDRKKFYISCLLGVLIAGIAVTLICYLIQNGFVAEDSLIRKLFIKQAN